MWGNNKTWHWSFFPLTAYTHPQHPHRFLPCSSRQPPPYKNADMIGPIYKIPKNSTSKPWNREMAFRKMITWPPRWPKEGAGVGADADARPPTVVVRGREQGSLEGWLTSRKKNHFIKELGSVKQNFQIANHDCNSLKIWELELKSFCHYCSATAPIGSSLLLLKTKHPDFISPSLVLRKT